MNDKYELKSATINEIELLIKYKLASILDYADDISKEEREKITNYVKTTVPKQVGDYKIIMIKSQIAGCLLIKKDKDKILLDEIYLEKEYRKKGIGTSIINNILAKNSQVYLWVYKKNKIAFNLYKKLGFKIKDVTETRYFMEYHKNYN